MARFDVYETGFDNFNETMCFGYRAIDGKSLYEICTLASIRSSDAVSKSCGSGIKVTSYYEVNGSIYLGIGSCLRILKSVEEPDLIAMHEFDDNLDAITVSSCGRFLLVCTQHGHIYISDLTLIQDQTTTEGGDIVCCPQLSFVYTEKVQNSSRDDIESFFLTAFTDETLQVPIFYVVTCTGLVKRISWNLEEQEKEDFISEQAIDLKRNVHVAAIAYPYLCMEGTELLILDLRNMDYQIDDSIGIKSLHSSGPNFFAFCTNGKIFAIDSARCLIFGVNNAFPDRLDDFENLWFIGSGDKQLIVALTKNQDVQAYRSLTDTDVIYDIHLEHPVHLNCNIKGYTEEIAFVSDIYKNDTLTGLRLQIITTTDPEIRVRKLINQRQIEKAELFAKKFNVDPECIAEVKVFNLIAKSQCTSEDIDKFLNILDTMKNSFLKLNFCDAVVCQTGNDTRRVLSYAGLVQAGDTKTNSQIDLLKRKCSAKLRRFDTYINIYKEYDQQQWSIFADCDLIEEMKKFLGQGRMAEANVLVLTGLYNEEFAADLTDDKVKEVLSAVDKKNIDENMTFLNAFIPLILKYKPDTIEIFVEWICNGTIEMEKNLYFPECAIRFLKDISNIIMHAPSQSQLDRAREKLLHLAKALDNIQKLKNNFHIHLPLKDCLDGPYAVVTALLNVCVMLSFEPTKLRLLMNDFLQPFFLECQEQADAILLKEIQGFFNIEEVYWLDTAFVLLEYISKIDSKISIIKQILITTSKPWSDKVKKIGSLAFNQPIVTPLGQEISNMLKNEQFLILLEKYNIKEKNFVSWDDRQFYFRRIIYLNQDDCEKAFNDIRQLCEQDHRFEADCLMMREFVSKGLYEEAFILMDKMQPQYMCSLGKKLLSFICARIRQFLRDLKLRESYYKALELLWRRLHLHCKESQLDEMLVKYNATRAIYWMYVNFKIELRLVLTPALLKTNIATFVHEINHLEPEIDIHTLIEHCEKVSSFFETTLDTVLLEYVKICEDFDKFVKIGEYLLEVSQCPQLLTQCAVNILMCLQQDSISMENKTFLDVAIGEIGNNGTSSVDIEAAHLARKLCVKATLHNEDEEKITLASIFEVLRLIDCNLCNLSSIGEELNTNQVCKKSADLFSLTATMPMMFSIYAISKNNLKDGFCSFFVCDQEMLVQEMQEELETFICNTRIVLNQKQHLNAFSMVSLVQRTAQMLPENHKDILKPLSNFLRESVLPQTVETLFAEKYIDTNLILQLLLLYDEKSFLQFVVKYLRFYKKHPVIIQAIALISLDVLNCRDIKYDKKLLVNVVNVCKWWFACNNSKMNCESFFTATPKSRLETLMKEEKVTVDHLPEYCADFGIDLQTCYLKYLKTLLLNWRPNVVYTTGINGKRGIKILNCEQELLDKCLKVLQCITDTNEVFNLTEQLWNSVNFYYYEVYLALLEIHKKVATSSLAISELYGPLIYFLQKYERVNKPTRTEIEMWCGANPLKPLIDPLSEFRLPLTRTFLSNDIWNIIKPEVNLETYKQWFNLTDFLSVYLKKQDICLYAITSPISSGLVDPTCATWELSLKYDFLLSKVYECAYSMNNLEQATAAVYSLMGQMPNGADKVEFAKLSYKFAKLYWESANNEAVKQTYEKVKQRYFNYSASHILHKYQLADVKYLELVAQPLDLISALYNDPRIESYYNNIVLQCPGINSAVEELCVLFQLDVLAECKRVLVQFLNSDFQLDLGCRRLQQDNLIKASYLCKGKNLDYWQKYLVEQGLDSEDNEIGFRANALRCFYYISPLNTIEQMCCMTQDEFLNYLNKVSIVAKLAIIGIKCESVSQLDGNNQKRLLRNLAKLNSPLAIQCIANICNTYGFNDLKYWEYIVNMAKELKMYGDLRDYLEFLSNRPVEEYTKKAWHVVLNNAFNTCKWETLSQAEIYLLIQNCPIFELDVEPYIEKCINHHRADLADIFKQLKK